MYMYNLFYFHLVYSYMYHTCIIILIIDCMFFHSLSQVYCAGVTSDHYGILMIHSPGVVSVPAEKSTEDVFLANIIRYIVQCVSLYTLGFVSIIMHIVIFYQLLFSKFVLLLFLSVNCPLSSLQQSQNLLMMY